MNIKDTIYKILFAIELALLPWVIFSYIYIPNWQLAVSIFIGVIAVCHIARQFIMDRLSLSHNVINAITSIIVFATLLIFFTCIKVDNAKLLATALVVTTIVVISLYKSISALLYRAVLPEMVGTIDYCYIIFEILSISTLIFVIKYPTIATVGLFAMIITAGISLLYKLYYVVKFYNVFDKIKTWFANRKTKNK